MSDERLIFRLEAENNQLVKKLAQSKAKMNELEQSGGKNINALSNDFQRLNQSGSRNLNKFGKSANDSIGGARRAMGQLGFQVQDVAVQLQGGQNPLLILGQQGSQVASIFGPGGAIIGAFLAVGAAIGTAFLPKLFDSTTALETLNEVLGELSGTLKKADDGVIDFSESLRELGDLSRIAALAQINEAILTTEDAISDAKSAISELVREQGVLSSSFAGLIVSFEKGELSARDLTNAYDTFFVASGRAGDEFREFRKELAGLALGSEEAENKLKRLNEALSTQDLGTSKKERDDIKDLSDSLAKRRDAFLDSQNKEKNDRLKSLQDSFFSIQDSMRSEEQVIEDSYNARLSIINSFGKQFPDMQAEANQARLQLQSDFNSSMEDLERARLRSSMSFMSGRLAVLANAYGEESALGKAAFAANKALSIATAIIDTNVAANAALKAIPGPGGIALSGLVRGLGYASVGAIAGQTIASFEGGGSTGPGFRAGGIDGKGGKMAILHPNEKVMDLTKGAANDGGWQVIVNNNTSAEVTPQINEDQKIISVMVDQVSRTTSPFMNAAQQSTNIRPRGSR